MRMIKRAHFKLASWVSCRRNLSGFSGKKPAVHDTQAHEPADSRNRALQSVNIAIFSQSVCNVYDLQRTIPALSGLMSMCCTIRMSIAPVM